jgi:hypothetical protein
MARLLEPAALRGSIERTDAALLCVRTGLVVPPCLVAASWPPRSMVNQPGWTFRF